MKKLIFTILIVGTIGFVAPVANAQMMGNFSDSSVDWGEVVEHTLIEEQKGQELWDKLQSEETDCGNLSDEQFGSLGEYFMGQMMGEDHAAMNAMMIQTYGQEGEEQIHIVMGKRFSGCDTSASASDIDGGLMPMMNMMMGGWSFPSDFNSQSNSFMMNFGFMPFSALGWVFMVLWLVLIIVAIIALIRWLMSQSRDTDSYDGRSALDILKERYAKGEIDRKEFEERKKDLTE